MAFLEHLLCLWHLDDAVTYLFLCCLRPCCHHCSERARAAQSRSDMDADLGGADISTTTTSFAGRSTTIDGLGEISAELNAIPPPEEDDFLMPPQQDEFMPPVDQPDEFIPPVEEEAAEEGVEVTASGRPVHVSVWCCWWW